MAWAVPQQPPADGPAGAARPGPRASWPRLCFPAGQPVSALRRRSPAIFSEVLGLKASLKITRPQPNTVGQTIRSIFRSGRASAVMRASGATARRMGDAAGRGRAVLISPGRKSRDGARRETNGNVILGRERKREDGQGLDGKTFRTSFKWRRSKNRRMISCGEKNTQEGGDTIQRPACPREPRKPTRLCAEVEKSAHSPPPTPAGTFRTPVASRPPAGWARPPASHKPARESVKSLSPRSLYTFKSEN